MKKIAYYIIAIWAILMPSTIMAQSEPYAVLSDNNTKLTFYYDDQKAARNGLDIYPFEPYVGATWYDQREQITNVVFDVSFANCKTITSTAQWFYGCTKLKTITGISNLNTDNVTDMRSMFQECSSLTNLDLSGFNTANVGIMKVMFFNSTNLETIYVGNEWSTASVTDGENMFSGCTNLVGGMGTKYDSNHTDHTYAHIDEGEANPGYFTHVGTYKYKLSISAKGNGSVSFDNNAIRNQTSQFAVESKTSATITMTPDEGYKINRLIVNNEDVTANIVDNQYTIDYIAKDYDIVATFTQQNAEVWTVNGSSAICGNVWDAENTANDMITTDGVTYTLTKEGVILEKDWVYELKVVKNHAWEEAYPEENYSFVADETGVYTVTISFNSETKEITHTVVKTGEAGPIEHVYSIIGSINGSWDTDTDMIKGNDGLYTATFTNVAAGTYDFIIRGDHEWGRTFVNSYYDLTVESDGSTVVVTFNEETKSISAVAYVPSNDAAKIKVSVAGKGEVYMGADYPTATADSEQEISIEKGKDLKLSFIPATGFKLGSVIDNGLDITSQIHSAIVGDKDWTGGYEGDYPYWYQFGENQKAFIESDPEGIAITLGMKTGEIYHPQISVLEGLNLKKDGNYRVVITAKFPSSGRLQVNMCSWNGVADQYEVPIEDTGDFQDVIIDFPHYSGDADDARVLFQSGDFLGTTIVKKVQVIDMYATYTLSNITYDHNFAVTFDEIPTATFNIKVSAVGNGKVSSGDTVIESNSEQKLTALMGTSLTLTLMPTTGYKLSNLTDNGTDVTLQAKSVSGSVVSERDWTGGFEGEYPYWYGYDYAQEQEKVITSDPDGVAINVGTLSGEIWQPQIIFLEGFNLENGHDYKVVLTAKIPSNGPLNLAIGAWGNDYSKRIDVVGSNDFQEIVVEFPDNWHECNGDAHLLLQFGELLGTSIVKKVQVLDMNNPEGDQIYTIANITEDHNITATFEQSYTTLTNDGLVYNVASAEDGTVVLANVDYGLWIEVPRSFNANNREWIVTGVENGALQSATELAAIIWNPDAKFTASVNNPNLLLYVKSKDYAPSGINNVIVDNWADNIILTDAAEGNNFYCPQAFNAAKVTYVHNYSMKTGFNTCQGWETIVLPFDVAVMTNKAGSILVPYSLWSHNDNNKRPFWLYTRDEAEGWKSADAINANVPYIISMPNNENYDATYNQSGDIEFTASNVEVKASDNLWGRKYGNCTLMPNYQNRDRSSDILALNVNNLWDKYTESEFLEGSTFIKDLRPVRPFEAYMILEGSSATRAISIFGDGNTTGIMNLPTDGINDVIKVYSLSGTLLKQGKREEVMSSLPRGIYIIDGKKVIK